MTPYVTKSELNVLAAAREALVEIQARVDYSDLEDDGWKRDSQLMALGRLCEAADVAENAVFNVLNTAKNHVGVDVPDSIMFRRVAEEVAS